VVRSRRSDTVRTVGDLDAITALVHVYAERLDTGDLDGVAHLFDHATWRSQTGEVRRGFDEVRPVYDRVILYEGTPRTKHLMTNLTIDLVDGAASADARCYFTVLQGVTPGEPIVPILSGRYVDRFERSGSEWRFADRLFLVDLVGDLSRHYR